MTDGDNVLQVDKRNKEQAVSNWIQRAAREVDAEPGVGWREIRLGRLDMKIPFLGRTIERKQGLGAVHFDGELVERMWAAGGENAVELAKQRITEAREATQASAEAELQQSLDAIAALIQALPEADREQLIDESVEVIEDSTRSLRKLRKRMRQYLLALKMEERKEEVARHLPELRIVDSKGAVQFQMVRSVPLEIANRTIEVPVVATANGGELEDLFLTGAVSDFIEAARTELLSALEHEEARWRDAAAKISEFAVERLEQRFYDAHRIGTILREELQDLETKQPDEVLRAVRSRIRKLDAAAKEKATVYRLAHENNLIVYKDFFSLARKVQRKLVMYVGPTNSGKTWHALNQLAEAKSGVYLAPLRLLALEGQEEIERRGPSCSYITGEERMVRPDAHFIASTIEMLDPTRFVEAAVIDEIQMLADDDRGWAWSQALVGVPAKTVIMTGSADAVPIVEKIAEHLGEELEINHLERFTPLHALPEPVRFRDIKPGTAVIAFSRRNVLKYKAQLAERHKVAVIYGNLTPEVRREEARRFRSGEADVLVATDAIAMGLNLPIETVLFSTLEKWNGKEEVQLTESQMLQIGGRAGRFGKYEAGYVGCLSRRDNSRIQKVFTPGVHLNPLPERAQVRPDGAHIDVIAEGIGTRSLKKALEMFQRGMTFDPPIFVPGVTEDMITIADLVDMHQHVSMAERLTLSCAPVDTRATNMMLRYQQWIAAYADKRPIRLPELPRNFRKSHAADDRELQEAEMEAKTLTVYAWLAYRFSEVFPDLEQCQAQRQELDDFIERSLARTAAGRQCRNCQKSLPAGFQHRLCDECYYEGF